MKKQLRIIFACAFVAATLCAGAQEGKKINLPGHTSHKKALARTQPTHAVASTSCGIDTLIYPYLKELAFTAGGDSFFLDAMIGNVRTAAQGYNNTSTLRIHGIQFYGGAYSTSPLPQVLQVKAILYSVSGTYQPLVALDSTLITVTNTYDFYEANFATTYTINTNFAVAIKNVINDTVAVVTNNAGAVWHTPQYGEGLAWRRFGSGSWNSALSFFGQDLEYMIFPIVSYDINAAFTASSDTICKGDTVDFTNTSTGPFADRMTNLRAFDAYWGLAADSSFKWNFGTSSSWWTGMNGSWGYPNAGTYTTTLAAEVLGYYTTCLDSAMMAITVDSVDVGVSVTSNTITASASGATYQWIDCNNANAPIVGETNQSFAAQSNGDYAVIVMKDGCTDTSACTNISSMTIKNAAKVNVSVQPNPTSGVIAVNSGSVTADAIVVKDLIGRVVKTVKPEHHLTSVDLRELPSSVYFVNIITGSTTRIVKLIKQ